MTTLFLADPEVVDLHVLLASAVLGVASCQVGAGVVAEDCDGTVVRMPEFRLELLDELGLASAFGEGIELRLAQRERWHLGLLAHP